MKTIIILPVALCASLLLGCAGFKITRYPTYSGPLRSLESTARLWDPYVLSVDGKKLPSDPPCGRTNMVIELLPGPHTLEVVYGYDRASRQPSTAVLQTTRKLVTFNFEAGREYSVQFRFGTNLSKQSNLYVGDYDVVIQETPPNGAERLKEVLRKGERPFVYF